MMHGHKNLKLSYRAYCHRCLWDGFCSYGTPIGMVLSLLCWRSQVYLALCVHATGNRLINSYKKTAVTFLDGLPFPNKSSAHRPKTLESLTPVYSLTLSLLVSCMKLSSSEQYAPWFSPPYHRGEVMCMRIQQYGKLSGRPLPVLCYYPSFIGNNSCDNRAVV
jgi:hypothetical protein